LAKSENFSGSSDLARFSSKCPSSRFLIWPCTVQVSRAVGINHCPNERPTSPSLLAALNQTRRFGDRKPGGWPEFTAAVVCRTLALRENPREDITATETPVRSSELRSSKKRSAATTVMRLLRLDVTVFVSVAQPVPKSREMVIP
jgi:hypothetical protein